MPTGDLQGHSENSCDKGKHCCLLPSPSEGANTNHRSTKTHWVFSKRQKQRMTNPSREALTVLANIRSCSCSTKNPTQPAVLCSGCQWLIHVENESWLMDLLWKQFLSLSYTQIPLHKYQVYKMLTLQRGSSSFIPSYLASRNMTYKMKYQEKTGRLLKPAFDKYFLCILNTLREARLKAAVQGAAWERSPDGPFWVLLQPQSLIKSQILAQRRGAEPPGLSGESQLQLNMPSTSNDSQVRWEEQNAGEKLFPFACGFYTFMVHVFIVLTKEQRQIQSLLIPWPACSWSTPQHLE